jgi:hypothetical protein
VPPFSFRTKKKALPDAGRAFFFNGCGLDGTVNIVLNFI